MSAGTGLRAKKYRILAAGCATAGLSSFLMQVSPSQAGPWLRNPFASRPATSADDMAPPALLTSEAQARPISPAGSPVSQTAGRRLRRLQTLHDAPKPLSSPQEATEAVDAPRPLQLAPRHAPSSQPTSTGDGQYRPMSPVERELQRLYDADGIAMPDMPDVSSESGEADQPASPRTQLPQPVPQIPQSVAPPTDHTGESAAHLQLDADFEDPAENEANNEKPRRGFLGLFRRNEPEPILTPLREPDPFVPAPNPSERAPVAPMPSPGTVPPLFAPASTQASEQPAVQTPAPAADSSTAAMHPLRARNYSAELFGEAAKSPVAAATPFSEQPAQAIAVPEQDAFLSVGPAAKPVAEVEEGFDFLNAGSEPDEELDFEAAPAVSTFESAESTAESIVSDAPAASLAATIEEAAEAESEEPFNPYTGLRLDQPTWGQPPVEAEPATESGGFPAPDDGLFPSLPPLSVAPLDSGASVSGGPQKTMAPVLMSPGRDVETETSLPSPFLPQGASHGEPGLLGFCPVQLRDHRQLLIGDVNTMCEYQGRSYAFSSADALRKFTAAPEKYVPAANGADVIVLAREGRTVEGSIDHSVWFKGKLYLFANADTMEAFATRPAAHAIEE